MGIKQLDCDVLIPEPRGEVSNGLYFLSTSKEIGRVLFPLNVDCWSFFLTAFCPFLITVAYDYHVLDPS